MGNFVHLLDYFVFVFMESRASKCSSARRDLATNGSKGWMVGVGFASARDGESSVLRKLNEDIDLTKLGCIHGIHAV